MNHGNRIRTIFYSALVLSVFLSGCSSMEHVSVLNADADQTIYDFQTAEYCVSKFKISQASTKIKSGDDIFALLDITDPDGNKISIETEKDKAFYENQKYSITISYEINADQKQKTSPLTFTVNVIDKTTLISTDVPSNTTVTYLYDGVPGNDDDVASTPSTNSSKQSSSKTTSSSKTDTSKASSNTGNSSVSDQSSTDQSSNSTVQSSVPAQVEQSQPVHVHEWKEHYASSTRTVQTGTIHHDAVTVEHSGYWWCGCGATFASEAEALSHQESEIDQGQMFNYGFKKGYTEVIQNAYDEPVYSEETYDYVDYYYCSCGATK